MAVAVDVINAKLHPLQHLEIIVHDKLLGEPRIQAVQDHLCAPELVYKIRQ